jgi:sec-independent protein translocase protein TatA
MFGMGTQELFVILLIVIFIFGVNKIPQLGKGLGEGIKNFKSALKAGQEESSKSDADASGDAMRRSAFQASQEEAGKK